jgi:YHS domain-containing protein/uncharacterized membrane protein YraQ (UPF0718 family)
VIAASFGSNAAESVKMAFFMFWETLWALVLGFGFSGAVQAFVSREEMERLLGDHGPKSVARATGFGVVSSSCSYAASAMAKSLFQKGADFLSAMVFMFASTNLVIELGIVLLLLLGWQFAVAEFVGGAVMIALLVIVGGFVLPRALMRQARERLQHRGPSPDHHEHRDMASHSERDLQRLPWSVKLRSAAGWADAAGCTIADLTMLRRELVIGYAVAGLLAALVSNNVWNEVFLTGHGLWTSVENAIVGPFIAFISFVCSIGNVPMAAALWHGGISFGGVISFVFADLIALPLVLIYRKFYGSRLTWRLFILFWAVMSAAGLVVEGAFNLVGAVPTTRPAQVVHTGLEWNHTTFLNIVFLALFALLVWLHRNRKRLGGGLAYANDPVCGMQVETANAPASAEHANQTYYFCSDGCHDRFVRNPGRYVKPAAGVMPPEGRHENLTQPADSIDPVCGMRVDPTTAPAHRGHNGVRYNFCSVGCAEAFQSNPDHYIAAWSPLSR